ncbi:MAG: shikimate dehydrogenase [Alphaproteobacteria bacterium]|nr:shikimate dehydrogenase [Alphaproteobacteria bacterium]
MRAISGSAKLAGVIGWPVSHSRSPRLHNYWLEKHKIDGVYVPLPVHPDHLGEVLKALPRMGFVGVNLTLPHKEAALRLVDQVDPTAMRIGAVNTIIFTSQGKSIGSCTDGLGFLENLRHSSAGFSCAKGPAVILGAGGAAAAIAFALQEDGCPEIRIANRTPEKAHALAQRLDGQAKVIAWEERAQALAGAALLVNTTSLGMNGQPILNIALDHLPKSALVTDIVYAPLETALLAEAKARGNKTVDGLGMLLHQARPGFAAWFGLAPEISQELRNHVLADG